MSIEQRLSTLEARQEQALEAALQHTRTHFVVQVGTSAPTHNAAEPTLYWDKTNDLFYIGGAVWTKIGGAGISAHVILDGSTHSDSAADGVTRGSLIVGNATPKWDELPAGSAATLLQMDGSGDAVWAAMSSDATIAAGGAVTVVSASTTAKGKVELATPAEINTSTDTGRAMSPGAFSDSNYGVRLVSIPCFAPGTDCATGDGAAFFGITSELNGMNLVSARAFVFTAGTTNSMTIAVYNITDSVDMLSTLLTVATTAVVDDGNAVIDTSNDDVATDDRLRIDVDAVHTTKAKGLVVVLGFRIP